MLAKDLLKIDKATTAIKKTLNGIHSPEDEVFFLAASKFVTKFEEILVDLHGDCMTIQNDYKKVCLMYGEKVGTDSEDIFGYVASFVDRYDAAAVKFAEEVEKAERARRKVCSPDQRTSLQGRIKAAALSLSPLVLPPLPLAVDLWNSCWL